MANYLIDGGAHIDAALTNLAIKAFDGGMSAIGPRLFTPVPVAKQSDVYYIVDPDSWLRIPDTKRAPKAPTNLGEWKVTSDTYFAGNFAFGTDYAKEALSQADQAVNVRQGSTIYVLEALMRDYERRCFLKIDSITNVGSGVALTGVNKWSAYTSSDPIGDVNSGHAFIRGKTGLLANVACMDYDTWVALRHHPVIRDYAKYTNDGPVPDAVLRDVFRVGEIMIAQGIFNSAKEAATASMQNMWGNTFFLAHLEAPNGLMTRTFGLGMRWQPDEFPGPMVVERFDHFDRTKRVEVQQAQYFQDEKIVAKDLGYVIRTTI